APHALACEIFAGSREFVRNLRPVAFELFGDELAQACEGSLAHFRACDADDDAVVGLDDDPGVHLGPRQLRGGLSAERDVESDREPGGCRAGEEGAAIDVGHVIHRRLPYAFAAEWIAVRTC